MLTALNIICVATLVFFVAALILYARLLNERQAAWLVVKAARACLAGSNDRQTALALRADLRELLAALPPKPHPTTPIRFRERQVVEQSAPTRKPAPPTAPLIQGRVS